MQLLEPRGGETLDQSGPLPAELESAPLPTARPDLSAPAFAFTLLVVLTLGAGLRLLPSLGASFPLGDGGMFYVMAQEIAAHGFALPSTTSYNAARIPFDYPPFGLYLVAALHGLFGWSWLTLFRLVPPLVSVATLGTFFLLARELLRTRVAVAASMAAFALTIDSFEWEIKGGGVTRSPGLFFALLAVWQFAVLYRTGSGRSLAAASVFSALTLLTHLEWSWFVACSALCFFAFLGRTRRAAIHTVVVGLAAVTLGAPWWILAVLRHGIRPFIATLSGSEQIFPWYLHISYVLALNLTDERLFSSVLALALIGFAHQVGRRRWFLPTWFVVVALLTSRGPNEKLVVVAAILSGVGWDEVLLPALYGLTRSWREAGRVSTSAEGVRGRRLAMGAAAILSLQTLLNTATSMPGNLPVLAESQRHAMEWIRTHTSPSSRFAMVTSEYWSTDVSSEWFPALAARRSLTTVQGTEWIPGSFAPKKAANEAVQQCASSDVSCLDRWLGLERPPPDYVYVTFGSSSSFMQCCQSLASALQRDGSYTEVFRNNGAAVFRWK